jgi:hypothetical protein
MTILLVATTAMVLLSLFLCWSLISSSRELRGLQTQMAIRNNSVQMIQVLAAESVEYSKRNPAIDPILEWIGAKPRTGASNAPTAQKPAGK